jgi:16S rRNA (guanine966-N2)-methyltransferase
VTRIISGFAGSIRLEVPSTGTRPTSDRVREAIFSALDARGVLDGARVLDLYAGTGALGLEAASRGATHVTLVESGQKAVAVARRNAATVLARAPRGAGPTIDVSGLTVAQFLSGAVGAGRPGAAGATGRPLWDVVLIDPPYELAVDELEQNLAALAPTLTPDAVVLIERSSRGVAPAWPAGLELDRRKDYGDTSLFWARPPHPEER